MSFQKKVSTDIAAGIAGQIASLNPAVFDTNNFPAGENGVTAGLAVWIDAANESYANAGTGKPLGIAIAEYAHANLDLAEDSSMTIPAGDTVTVLKKGDIYVNCTTASTVGQKIFANTKDGTLKADAASADTEGSDFVETDFAVVESGSVNSLILISNWS